MNKILKTYYESALALKLPVTYIEELRSLNIYLGKKNYFLLRGISQLNNSSSIYISNNKQLTKLMMQAEGIHVPSGVAINRASFKEESLQELIKLLDFPLIVKPMKNTNSGTDVVCNIKTIEELTHYLKKFFKTYTHLLVEEYKTGLKEYRVLLLNNRIIAVAQRFAQSVVGDGHSSIEQLLQSNVLAQHQEKNFDLQSISNDDCTNCLSDQGLTFLSIPQKGEIVRLRYAVNRGLGGRVTSIDKNINRVNAQYLRKASKVTGLDLVGLDVMCEDINLPFNKSEWMILEANFCPDITLHEAPDEGKKIQVCKKILAQIIVRHPFAYLRHRLMHFSQDTKHG